MDKAYKDVGLKANSRYLSRCCGGMAVYYVAASLIQLPIDADT